MEWYGGIRNPPILLLQPTTRIKNVQDFCPSSFSFTRSFSFSTPCPRLHRLNLSLLLYSFLSSHFSFTFFPWFFSFHSLHSGINSLLSFLCFIFIFSFYIPRIFNSFPCLFVNNRLLKSTFLLSASCIYHILFYLSNSRSFISLYQSLFSPLLIFPVLMLFLLCLLLELPPSLPTFIIP